MTEVKITSLNPSFFDTMTQIMKSKGFNNSRRVLLKEAQVVGEEVKKAIRRDDTPWGNKVDKAKASSDLADSIVVEPTEDGAVVKFRKGRHTETGRTYQVVAGERERRSPHIKEAVDKLRNRKQEIGQKILKEHLELFKEALE